MPPKPFTKIALSAFIIAIAGLSTSVYKFTTTSSRFLLTLWFMFKPYNLSWFDDDENVFTGGYTINVLTLLVSLVFLAAAVFYLSSKRKEIALLRFMFSLVFISKAVGFLFGLFAILFFPQAKRDLEYFISIIVSWLVSIAFFYISYRVLKQLHDDTLPDTEEYGEGESKFAYLRPASKWQRLFHSILNVLIGMALFTPIVSSLRFFPKPKAFLEGIAAVIGERPTLYLFVLIFSLIYYFITESILGANPAMLLSGTRVTTEEGGKPGPKAILKRTLSRFIPFDGLSFLLSSGWHDQLSHTVVVKEKRTGVHPATYFVIIPIILFAIWGIKTFALSLETWQQEDKKAKEAAAWHADMEDRLAHLNTNSFIRLESIGYYENDKPLVLKVEAINKDSIAFSKLYRLNTEGESQPELEALYNSKKDSLKKVKFTRALLRQVLMPEYGIRDNNAGLKIRGVYYRIKEIENFFQPNLKTQSSGIYAGKGAVFIQLMNTGWKATLTDVTVLEGDLNISKQWPRVLYSSPLNRFGGNFEMYIPTKATLPAFKIQLSLVDTLGRKQVYQFSGDRDNQMGTLKRVQ